MDGGDGFSCGSDIASNASSELCHALTTYGFVVTRILHAHRFSGHVVFVSGNTAF